MIFQELSQGCPQTKPPSQIKSKRLKAYERIYIDVDRGGILGAGAIALGGVLAVGRALVLHAPNMGSILSILYGTLSTARSDS